VILRARGLRHHRRATLARPHARPRATLRSVPVVQRVSGATRRANALDLPGLEATDAINHPRDLTGRGCRSKPCPSLFPSGAQRFGQHRKATIPAPAICRATASRDVPGAGARPVENGRTTAPLPAIFPWRRCLRSALQVRSSRVGAARRRAAATASRARKPAQRRSQRLRSRGAGLSPLQISAAPRGDRGLVAPAGSRTSAPGRRGARGRVPVRDGRPQRRSIRGSVRRASVGRGDVLRFRFRRRLARVARGRTLGGSVCPRGTRVARSLR
jgi:hypothetical protein